MSLGMLTLHLQIPGCTSLKEKRSRLKPLLARLHKEFNISVAELGAQDAWQQAIIGCAFISSDANITRSSLQAIISWVENNWPDMLVLEDRIELL